MVVGWLVGAQVGEVGWVWSRRGGGSGGVGVGGWVGGWVGDGGLVRKWAGVCACAAYPPPAWLAAQVLGWIGKREVLHIIGVLVLAVV